MSENSPLRPVSDAQVRALERIIACYKGPSDFAKKAVIGMLRQCEHLSQPGVFFVPPDAGTQVWDAIHGMEQSIYLPWILEAMGTHLVLDGSFDDGLDGYIFSLLPRGYDREKVSKVDLNIEDVKKIDLHSIIQHPDDA